MAYTVRPNSLECAMRIAMPTTASAMRPPMVSEARRPRGMRACAMAA